ncbi:hypothetical protein R5R35_007954 [Gryllus longicercus]|uniref:C2H2-type domain-containing protein n=1 Tax=Gryllus longicercus TaxID=2509291 RepID=A0AAN9V6T8_9ORTH
MQSVGGLNKTLECADCKTSFTSASLLLKHFAEHIIDQATETELSFNNESGNATTHKKIKLSLLQAKKKERKESILETVLRQSAIQCCRLNEKLPPVSSLQNDIASYSNTSSSDSFKSSNSQNCVTRNSGVTNCVKVEDVALPDDMVLEIGQRAKAKHKFSNDMTLVKFDLQKRLENCVSRLALKRGYKEEISKNCPLNHKQEKSTPVKINALPLNKEVTKKCEGEDFSPLKFCVVTLEDGVEKEDAGSVVSATNELCISKPLKGASNRKQLMPKKIHRPKEDSASEVLKTEVLSISDNKNCQKPSTKRKYLCHVCSKSFGWSTDLKRHILTHTGERPFKCQMCDATFTRNFLLQKHESRVHSLDNVDNRFTQEEVGESVKSAGNNNEMIPKDSEKQILPGRGQQNKVWKNNRLLSDNMKDSLVASLNKTCDKYVPAKRKLQCEESSFDHFPQKVFNIL